MTGKIVNTILLPLRMICSHEFANKLGLRSLRDERYDMVAAHCRGRLLDVGCGNNELVRRYGHESVGVDVYDFGGGAVRIEDAAQLPFEDGSFETVGFVACLNHIPRRREAVREARRVLSTGGRVIVTILSPRVGLIRHKLAWWDPDRRDRGMAAGEAFGLSRRAVVLLFQQEGFRLVARKRFICGLNNLYVFEKAPDAAPER